MENIQGQISCPHAFVSRLSEIQGNLSLSREDLSIATRVFSTISSIYNPVTKRNLDYFLSKLEKSGSVLKRKYAIIVRQNKLFEQNTLHKLAKIFEILEFSSINQVSAALSQLPQNYAQIGAYQKEATKAFAAYRELFSDVEEIFPKQHPLYQSFQRIHLFNQEELPIIQKEIEHVFDTTVTYIVFDKKKDAEHQFSQIRTTLDKALVHSIEEITLLIQTHGTTQGPIEEHLETLAQITSFISENPLPGRPEIRSLSRKIHALQAEEPKFAEAYGELQELLISYPLNAVHILKKSAQLQEAFSKKIRDLILRYKIISTDPLQQIYKPPLKTLSLRRCENLSCPLAQKQKEAPAQGQMTTIVLKCTRCLKAVYCSRECQREDWPRHKQLCIKI